MRAGFVAIVGLPNVGKSTLLNRLLGQKIAITSPRPQTTRNRILGVKNLPDAELVLVDTPGLHRPSGRAGSSPLNRYMVDQALGALGEVDAVLALVEPPLGVAGKVAARGGYRIGGDHSLLLEALRQTARPTVLAINKIDLLGRKDLLLPVIEAWRRAYPFRSLMPISAATGDGVDALARELRDLLPEGDRLFPEEMVTDRAERWLAAEMVREQVFLLTRKEVPYAVAVTIDEFVERPDRKVPDVAIAATIHVEKEAQKRIVVGEGGRMVREIGTRARFEIGRLLDCPVHLKLFVRVDPGWTQRAATLRDMGYE